jgi:hypothetical protein
MRPLDTASQVTSGSDARSACVLLRRAPRSAAPGGLPYSFQTALSLGKRGREMSMTRKPSFSQAGISWPNRIIQPTTLYRKLVLFLTLPVK